MERVANWLLEHAGPQRRFRLPGHGSATPTKLVAQMEVKHSMTAAGLGSLYVCDHLLKLTDEACESRRIEDDTPPGLKEVKPEQEPQKPKPRFDPQLVQAAEDRGNGWFDANFKVEVGQYNYYYLYAYERYRSFREEVEQRDRKEPAMVQRRCRVHPLEAERGRVLGARRRCTMRPSARHGVCRPVPAAQHPQTHRPGKSSHRRQDGDRPGIPEGHRRTWIIDPNGRLVTKPREDPAEALLKALEDKENKDPDKTAELLAQLPDEKLEALSTKDAAAIRKLVSNKLASTRMVAVRALCKTPRDLDNVPVLIYALSDPDLDIAREANDGLRRIARSPSDPNSEPARARRTSGCLPAPATRSGARRLKIGRLGIGRSGQARKWTCRLSVVSCQLLFQLSMISDYWFAVSCQRLVMRSLATDH